MNEPKVIQSFYSRNCGEFGMFLQSCYFTLSSIYAHNSGIDITLYTDYDFKQILDRTPYKEIKDFFRDDYSNISYLMWAWPKFYSLDVCPRDTIHIDGDIFLKDSSCKDLLDYKGRDVLVQHVEHRYHSANMASSYEETYDSVKHLKWPSDIDKRIPDCMFNNGILGVNNESLWKDYVDHYEQMLKQCVPDSIEPIGWCIPDIIFEQYFLYQLVEKHNLTYNTVLNGNSLNELNIDAISKKYQHICAEKKQHLYKCIRMIKNKDITCYEALEHYWKDKYPEYFEIND